MEDYLYLSQTYGDFGLESQEIDEAMNSPQLLMEGSEDLESAPAYDYGIAPSSVGDADPSMLRSPEAQEVIAEADNYIKNCVDGLRANDFLSGDDTTTLCESLFENVFNSVPLDEIQPRRGIEVVVAPAMMEYSTNPPMMGMGATAGAESNTMESGRTSRRKSNLANMRSSIIDTPDFCDMKPIVAELPVEEGPSTRGRKRSQPVPSPQPPSACKRIKKYELEDTENPSVRNARAAKANREKKKQELVDLKTQIQEKEKIIRDLTEENKKMMERLQKAEAAIARLSHQQQSSNGILQVREDILRYLSTTIPQLGQTFRPIPTIVLAPGLMPQEPGTRCINSQFNLDNGTFTISPGTNN